MGAPDSISTMSATFPIHSERSTKEHFENREKKHPSTHHSNKTLNFAWIVLFQSLSTCRHIFTAWVIGENCSGFSQEPDTIQLMSLNFPSKGLFFLHSLHSLSVSHSTNTDITRLWCYSLGSTEMEVTKSQSPTSSSSQFNRGNRKLSRKL